MRIPLVAMSALALVLCTVVAAGATSNPGDAAIAKRAAFRVADFPAGWSQGPAQGKDTGCFTGPAKKNSPTAYLSATRFSSGENGTDASQFVAVYGTAAGARRALAAVTAASRFACYKAHVPAQLATAGLKMDGFSGGRLSFDPVGDTVRAYRYKIAVSKGSQKDAVYLDYVFVLRGRVLVSSGFTQASSEPDVFTEHSVLAKVVARISKFPSK